MSSILFLSPIVVCEFFASLEDFKTMEVTNIWHLCFIPSLIGFVMNIKNLDVFLMCPVVFWLLLSLFLMGRADTYFCIGTALYFYCVSTNTYDTTLKILIMYLCACGIQLVLRFILKKKKQDKLYFLPSLYLSFLIQVII